MLALALLGSIASPPALANDRPFQAVRTAAAEEDDDQAWSVSTTAERLGAVRALSLELEYAFNPLTSLQFRYGHARERGTGLREQSGEIEGKYLFNHIARDGWGVGISAAHTWTRASDAGWEGGHWELRLPVSLHLSPGGAAMLHANLGWSQSKGSARERIIGIAGQAELRRAIVLFAEREHEGERTFTSVGVRHWVKRERFAVDVSLQRATGNGKPEPGFLVGFSWYDL